MRPRTNSAADRISSPGLVSQSHRQTKNADSLSCDSQSAGLQAAYRTIAKDPKYKHFINIPDRIIRCIDHFEIDGNRKSIKARLQSFYLFIGVVDDAIDSGQIATGARVLNYLDGGTPKFDEGSRTSNIELVTEILKRQISGDDYWLIVEKFRSLYQEVLRERAATSIEHYIDRRQLVGSLTAELSYLLISPLLKKDSEALRYLMKDVGAVGCLVDSLIDLDSDYRLGLLVFKPTLRCYAKLLSRTVQLGLSLSLKHPRLCLLFLQAIFDNIRDRISRNQPHVEACLSSEGKEQAASVA